MKKFIYLVAVSLCLQSCGSISYLLFRPKTEPVPSEPQTIAINLALVKEAQSNKFVNQEYGIRLNVKDNRADTRVLQKYDANNNDCFSRISVFPDVQDFVSESISRYMRTMGFDLDADIATDFMMQVEISEFNMNYLSGVGWMSIVKMEVEIYDQNRVLVYPKVTVTGRANQSASSTDFEAANRTLNTAYANALEDIDWDRIAFFLNRNSNPALEGNKKVSGDGNTALEHLTIHWDVNSRPQGADIFWRVISSTPEVKNQNYRYLQTTPYETTEVFDIKGLTYNNAGNVQIEIKCEKTGYYTQSKKFNVSSIIEEKEISAFFRLVSEEE